MFIDYLTIMLINIVAGLVITALFVLKYLEGERWKAAPGFLVTGFIALVTGFHLIFTWPLPGSYNIPFGEMTILYGALYIAAGIAVLMQWDLLTLAVYAVFAGAASIVLGIRIFDLKMTNDPLAAMAGFVLSGLAGVLSLPVYLLRKSAVVRILAAILALAAAAVWAILVFAAYWDHLSVFSKWVPILMRLPPAPAK
jgi:putative membrane protein